jgi:hypothetical protein
MVKLGFIVEGATEKIILQHSDFFSYLDSLGIKYIDNVIDAKGNGNLLPHNIEAFNLTLKADGATHIIILTDLDKDECITKTKARIGSLPDQIIIVSVKVVESWFLSDTSAIRNYLGDASFSYDQPESIENPFEEIKAFRKAIAGKGFTDKRVLANSMVRKYGFSIQNAAKHPNCTSAKYFLNKINELAKQA